MTVVMIYPPEERHVLQPLCDALRARGCEVAMAPLGLEAGSEQWVAAARKAIEDSVFCIVLLSDKSVLDLWGSYKGGMGAGWRQENSACRYRRSDSTRDMEASQRAVPIQPVSASAGIPVGGWLNISTPR